jgi:hypothetical protein
VNTRRRFLGESLIDQALARDPALPGKGRRHTRHRKTGFALGARTSVTNVGMGFIGDIEPDGLEAASQLLADRNADRRCVTRRLPWPLARSGKFRRSAVIFDIRPNAIGPGRSRTWGARQSNAPPSSGSRRPTTNASSSGTWARSRLALGATAPPRQPGCRRKQGSPPSRSGRGLRAEHRAGSLAELCR